ncbi:MAG: helix-hairpin-helix domain-containing protein [Eubacteriales bacterium]|nr:helix-hairpin-helix domain-containing protein [Eubacteriales bacterium]
MKKRNHQNRIKKLCVLALCLLNLCTFSSGCGRKEAEFLISEMQGDASNMQEESAQIPALTPQTSAIREGEAEKPAASSVEGETEGSAASSAEGETQEPAGASAEGETQNSAATSAETEAEIYVDVCGAVAEPGVYSLKPGSRVFQAIELAGGLLPEAAAEYVNRAKGLTDGEQVYIPTREEAETGDLLITAPQPEKQEAASASETGGKVNLNTADAEELMTLKGIGATRADAILAYRAEHGGFSSIEEIMNVQGIKEGTFEKIKDNIAVE